MLTATYKMLKNCKHKWQMEVAEMSDRDTLRQKNMEDLKSKWKKFLKRQAEKKNAEQGKQTQMH